MINNSQWNDLKPRITSGVIMAGIGLLVLLIGGWLMAAAVAVLAGVMVWEASNMALSNNNGSPLMWGALAGLAVVLALILGKAFAVPLAAVATLVAVQNLRQHQREMGAAVFGIILGSVAFVSLRNQLGFDWLLWVVLVVIASDVAGYFVGKTYGGPKFWPAISPKKTWSGTLGGWAAAAVVGIVFSIILGAGFGLVIVSVLVCFSGQMGDIAESAFKRRMKAKDSSNLIPGHGGVWDRFDAMLGASLMAWFLWLLGWLPGAS